MHFSIRFSRLLATALLSALAPAVAFAGFSFKDDGLRLIVLENGQPVLAYNYGRIDPPEGIGPEFWRSDYIHPVYGLDGEILTQDFPADHPHHRGISWMWPEVTVGDRLTDPWALSGSRQLFVGWDEKQAHANRAELRFRAGWRFDEEWEPFIAERIHLNVHAAEENSRVIDIRIQLKNVSSTNVSLRGRGKTGYGGLSIRPDGDRPNPTIVTAKGKHDADVLDVESAWADFSSTISEDGRIAGMAIFQHPENPGYPHSGWLLRHYGFLGPSWPQFESKNLAPGETVTLRYRILIHRYDAEKAKIDEHFEDFIKQLAR